MLLALFKGRFIFWFNKFSRIYLPEGAVMLQYLLNLTWTKSDSFPLSLLCSTHIRDEDNMWTCVVINDDELLGGVDVYTARSRYYTARMGP